MAGIAKNARILLLLKRRDRGKKEIKITSGILARRRSSRAI